MRLFTLHKVFTEAELTARTEIMLENYAKVLNIEAMTMIEMTLREILPAIERFIGETASAASAKKALSPALDCQYETDLVAELSALCSGIHSACNKLRDDNGKAIRLTDAQARANAYRDHVIPQMEALRALADKAETLVSSDLWPFPTYGELLFGIR